MGTSEEDKQKARKDIYNDAVRLLEMLNVMIPKVESNSKMEANFIKEISDKCFELGVNIATSADDMAEPPEDEWEGMYCV